MDLGRTGNDDHFALGSLGVGEELFIWYGGRHIGRVEYERSLDVDERKSKPPNTTPVYVSSGLRPRGTYASGSRGGDKGRVENRRLYWTPIVSTSSVHVAQAQGISPHFWHDRESRRAECGAVFARAPIPFRRHR